MAANLETATGTHAAARTISRRLNQVGLYARKPVRCIPVQPHHRQERLRWLNISVALFSYARAFGYGPRNFKPWSSDKDDTRAGTPSPNYHTTPTRRRSSSRQI
ncbi:hypothetical protein TNCV_2278101 [Trichonephila clavipes]|nr:hypothetical protein TNCV_2278101 [Trichonephila clavipes]